MNEKRAVRVPWPRQGDEAEKKRTGDDLTTVRPSPSFESLRDIVLVAEARSFLRSLFKMKNLKISSRTGSVGKVLSIHSLLTMMTGPK